MIVATSPQTESIAELERFGMNDAVYNAIEKMGIVFIRDLDNERITRLTRTRGFDVASIKNLNLALRNYKDGNEVKTAYECTYPENKR